MLPVSRVKGRVYFYIYIVINRTRMSQTVLREKLEFFSLRKKTPDLIRFSTMIEKRHPNYNCSIYLYSSYKMTIIDLRKL